MSLQAIAEEAWPQYFQGSAGTVLVFESERHIGTVVASPRPSEVNTTHGCWSHYEMTVDRGWTRCQPSDFDATGGTQ